MTRPDLLALSTDDLVLLANRGLVRRARAEVESGDLACELREGPEGDLEVRWSDGVTCLLPAGAGLAQGRCSCPATTLCRHLLRSVLVYQREHSQREHAQAPLGGPSPAPAIAPGAEPPREAPRDVAPEVAREGPWDPGTIADAILEGAVPRATLAAARRDFTAGQVLELARGRRPVAYVHSLTCTVRFLVPGDVRYARCDCAGEPPCRHVPLAVWAFRLLTAGEPGGIVCTSPARAEVPGALLEDVEGALGELLVAGVAGSPEPALARLRHLEDRCREGGLIWPAEALGELAAQCAAYGAHDARFSPLRVAEVVGELCVRLDAIRADTGAVPSLFVRGGAADRPAAVGAARLIGLGCGARPRRGGVEIAAYLQDSGSGRVLAVRRDFPDPPPEAGEAPADFWRLARMPRARGIPLGAMGGGQVLAQGGWRTSGAEYVPGRARLVLNPQAFTWEQLRAPTLAQGFAEVTARLGALPPPALRPRRLADDLCAFPVAAVEGARFESAEQTVQATLRDAEGGTALLRHPYLSRAREGAEALLRLLAARPQTVRFVAGRVQRRAESLLVAPVAVVYEAEGRRRMLQPWVEGGADAPAGVPGAPTG